MDRLAGILGILASLASFPVAAAYDDPAVAVCQFTKFHGQDPSATGYRRTSAKIDGQKVFIELERSTLNTAPRREMLECWFRERDGYFHIVDPIEEKKRYCTFIENAAGYSGASEDAQRLWEQQQSACFALYSEPEVPYYEFERLTIEPLLGTGIYPISIVDTQMRVSD